MYSTRLVWKPIVCPLFAVLLGMLPAPADAAGSEAEVACDVLVYGATPGGIAAAVAAGRSGRSVVPAEFDDHIGGIVSNGLTNADIDKRQAVGGKRRRKGTSNGNAEHESPAHSESTGHVSMEQPGRTR
jgi:hypothetical protein